MPIVHSYEKQEYCIMRLQLVQYRCHRMPGFFYLLYSIGLVQEVSNCWEEGPSLLCVFDVPVLYLDRNY